MNLNEYVITFLIASILIFLTILKKEILFKLSNDYQNIQKIHDNYIPPFGGLIIFISFYFYLFIFYKQENFFTYFYVLIPSLLIICVSTIEDLFNNVKPIVRFIIIFISSIIYCALNDELPVIEIWILGEILNNYSLLNILFFSICLTALTNGMNMIDGMNGLAGMTSLCILSSLISLLILFNYDEVNIKILFVLAGILIIFLFFNFPFGKIFLGDTGAYWIGWILGALIIEIFNNAELNTWIAPLLLFYPTMEVVFSTLRKLYNKGNPLLPDLDHLHLKLYFVLKGPVSRKPQFNSFTTVCLMPFWICPILTIVWVQKNPEIAKYFLILFIVLYLIYYLLIPKKENSK